MAENAKKITEEFGVKCICHYMDFTDSKSITNAVEDIIAEMGKIDILINSGGTGGSGDPATTTDEEWLKVIDVDLNGQYYLARDVVRLSMLPNNYGRIVNVASIHGLVSRKNVWTAAYCAAKGGIVNLTRALANDWGKHNITVNCIAPGYFPSELTAKYINTPEFIQLHVDRCPMERTGRTGEMDGLCVYLSSPCCSYTTGQTIAVDGGWTCN